MSLMIAQQVLAGGLHLVDVVALARRRVGLQRQVRQADDGVHRGADLMAHVGQEVRLHARRFLGHLLGLADVFLCTFQIGNHAAGEGGGMILGFLGELAVRLGAKKLSLELLNLALEDLEPVGQIGGRRLGHGQPAMSNVTKLSL